MSNPGFIRSKPKKVKVPAPEDVQKLIAKLKEVPPHVVIPGKNPSWRNGMWVALNAAIIYAPTNLYNAVKPGLIGIVSNLLRLVFTLTVWAVSIPVILITGLLGRAKRPTFEEYVEHVSRLVSRK